MAGLPAKRSTSTNSNKVPAISHDVYEFLMNAYSPITVTHSSPHADMIKNVVLEEVRGTLNVLYTRGN